MNLWIMSHDFSINLAPNTINSCINRIRTTIQKNNRIMPRTANTHKEVVMYNSILSKENLRRVLKDTNLKRPKKSKRKLEFKVNYQQERKSKCKKIKKQM